MEYSALAAVYRRLEETSADTEKVETLAAAFADADDILPAIVQLARGIVFAPWQPADLGVSSSLTKRAVVKATGVDGDRIEEWWKETGDLGGAAERAVEQQRQQTLFSNTLTVEQVYDRLQELATYGGSGSQDRKVDAVAGLVSDADPEEARYVVRTVLGNLRVGVGEGTVRDAVAQAFDVPVDAVEHAFQVTNDFRIVAETARDGGESELRELSVELFRPVQSMLAKKAEALPNGLADVGEGELTYLEYKYDGARVQVHKNGEEVRVFTRRLVDVTDQFPDVVRAVRSRVTAERCILDGELVGYDPETNEPVPFQQFSRRIKRKYEVERLAEEIPVVFYAFDVLFDGEPTLDEPLRRRLDRLDGLLDPKPRSVERAAHLVPEEVADADAFYREALEAGHEGVMLKNLDASYEPSRRVGTMAKVKPVMETLDLVVPRGQYSEGRRSEQLGRLFLACYDTDHGEFREIGRLATGYTDEELAALTKTLEPLITEREGRRVELSPEVVLEIEYEEIQESPEYDSGYALRFPRFIQVRDDLGPTDADTCERVEELYDSQ